MQISDKQYDIIIFTFIVLVVAFILSSVTKKALEFIFTHLGGRIKREKLLARTNTIRSILQNIVDVVIFFMAILVILSKWDINIMPLLTGAGILGLAVSFGSQTLIKDLIAGFFIILEDQFNVGDRIKVDSYEGEVKSISLRLTILKDKNGNLIYLPNSSVTNVVRYTRVQEVNVKQQK